MAIAESALLSGDIDIFNDPRITILPSKPGALVQAHVDVSLLDDCGCPVDKDNVDRLLEDFLIQEQNPDIPYGQLEPILTGQIAGHNRLAVMDGLHRKKTVGILAGQDAEVSRPPRPAWCVIVVGTNWDEVTDSQIKQSRKHKTIGPARWAHLVERSWRLNPLSEKLYSFELFDRRFLQALPEMDEMELNEDLTDDEMNDSRKWARMKLKTWGLKAGQFQRFLSAVAVSDATLANSTVVVEGGRFTALPTSQFIAIAEELPGVEDIHKLIAEQVIKEQLNVGESAVLARALYNVRVEDAPGIIASRNWKGSAMGLSIERRGGVDSKDRTIARLKNQVREQEEEIIRLTRELSAARSVEKTPTEQDRLIWELKHQLEGRDGLIEQQRKRISSLESDLSKSL